MMFFMVFKSPAEGRTHIFRPNEPFARFTVIPEESNFELVEMSVEELPSENCRPGVSTRAALLCLRHPMDVSVGGYSTPLTGVFMARRENFRRASTRRRG
jgi:hypothetical protein